MDVIFIYEAFSEAVDKNGNRYEGFQSIRYMMNAVRLIGWYSQKVTNFSEWLTLEF